MGDSAKCPHTREVCPDGLDALDDAWRNHASELLARCMGWSRGRTEDAREAFSRTWSRATASMLAERPHLIDTRAWLLTLAYHACMDLYRERTRRGEEELDATGRTGAAPADPERLALGKELSTFLLGAIEQLPSRLREPMQTYMTSGSYREVVERFGITEANARKRVQQARAILRKRLGDYRRGRTPRRRR